MLITDVYLLDELEVLEEGIGAKTMKVRGVFQRAEEANANKRIYPRPLLESQVNKLQPLIQERRLCGELDHPQNDSVKLANASHLVTKLEMRNNDVVGEAEILNTPAGMTARALIKGGVKIGISSRGMGSLSESEDGTKKVNEDFKLVTFDLVADPSTRGAYPSLSESKQYRDLYEKSTSEKVFINLLRDKLHEKVNENQGYRKAIPLEEKDKGKLIKAALGFLAPVGAYAGIDHVMNKPSKMDRALGKARSATGAGYAAGDTLDTLSARLRKIASKATGKKVKSK